MFFPEENPTAALLATCGVFAAGFIMRPLGGILLGIYADRPGRKRALSLLTLMMAAGTLIVARSRHSFTAAAIPLPRRAYRYCNLGP